MQSTPRSPITTTSVPTESSKPISANDKQPGGSHYRAAYQHWDFVADAGLGYFEGQVTKYTCRHRKKNGLLDVEKAEHFLEKMVELRLKNTDHFRPVARTFAHTLTQRFIAAQEPPLGWREGEVIKLVVSWEKTLHLQQALDLVREIKQEYTAYLAGFGTQGEATNAYNAQSLDAPKESA